MVYKYPRTPHLPWSPGCALDDELLPTVQNLEGEEVVITEKLDGENTSMYSDYIHARSVHSANHPSRDWVKALHGNISALIPTGWRVCGENLFARHSIAYSNLSSYFFAFSIWNEHNQCLSWAETLEWTALLEIEHVPVIYQGIFDERTVRNLRVDETLQEGYVVRLAKSFSYEQFALSVAKWVRKDHVQTSTHWMHQQVVPNELAVEQQ